MSKVKLFWSILMSLCGLFFFLAACFNWTWFLQRQDAPLLGDFVGQAGVRIFYGLLGLGIMSPGILWRKN